jgi:CheY-like chemotaxis protein
MQPSAEPLVLVVEDDPTQPPYRVAALEHAGFRCAIAGNADEGLAALQRERPQLVVMDFNLPGLDGLELTRWIKADALTNSIPVLRSRPTRSMATPTSPARAAAPATSPSHTIPRS